MISNMENDLIVESVMLYWCHTFSIHKKNTANCKMCNVL